MEASLERSQPFLVGYPSLRRSVYGSARKDAGLHLLSRLDSMGELIVKWRPKSQGATRGLSKRPRLKRAERKRATPRDEGVPSHGLASEGLLGRALNAISESALVTDADQRIVYANAAFTAVTGYSAEEVLGRNCRLLQGPGTDALTVTTVRMTLARQETFRGEILNYRKDGTAFWNALTVSPLRNEDGVVTHFVSVQRDITAQKNPAGAARDSGPARPRDRAAQPHGP